MSTTPAVAVSAAELRRRVRAVEALQAKTRETAAANVLTTREAAVKAARAKEIIGLGPGLFPLTAVNGAGPDVVDEQLALIGEPTPVRIPAGEWMLWLTDASVQARYWAKAYRTSSTEDCWFFLGRTAEAGVPRALRSSETRS
ncbi:hypothetical protein [Streptomyces sp. NPDC094437]|uniref:hypothetical protein n=1 Tax=Streptomyces sp. NPDC094437 TaxID=3366060 RepID=UPI00380DAA2C